MVRTAVALKRKGRRVSVVVHLAEGTRRGRGANRRTLEFFIPLVTSLSFIRMGEGIVSPAPPRSSYLPPTTIKPLAAMKQGFCLHVMVCLQEIKTGGVVRVRGRRRPLFFFLYVSSLPVFARCHVKAGIKRETA